MLFRYIWLTPFLYLAITVNLKIINENSKNEMIVKYYL